MEVLLGILVMIMFMLFLNLFMMRMKYCIVFCSFLWYCWKVFKLCVWLVLGDLMIGFVELCWLFVILFVIWLFCFLVFCFFFWLNEGFCKILRNFGFWLLVWEGDELFIVFDFVLCRFMICLIGEVMVCICCIEVLI